MTYVRTLLLVTICGITATSASAAFAQSIVQPSDAERMQALEDRLAAQDARIAELERLLQANTTPVAVPVLQSPPVTSEFAAVAPVSAPVSAPMPTQSVAATATSSRLNVSGDLRLREEFNWSDADGRDRTRSVLRARLRSSYAVNDAVTVGVQIATGDQNDPNSTDVTLGDFVNDLNVSLDQAYMQFKSGNLTLWGGKFANPFRRTDLVWDGDVSPQGVAATYTVPIGGGAKLEARALYFLLNESTTGKGSDMLGGQVVVSAPFEGWNIDLAASYYDYGLRSLTGADAGDFRTNLRRPDGSYLSDFNLGDAIVTVTYKGMGANWPIGLTGHYVHNFGTTVDASDGYSVELFAGRASKLGDWRFGYNYAVAENEAVFAAVSHDNLGIATNYRLHALSVDHVLLGSTVLNLTAYHYRPDNPIYAGANQPKDWLNRVRVNLLFNF